jgi:hypothetical protein
VWEVIDALYLLEDVCVKLAFDAAPLTDDKQSSEA